MTYSVRLRQQIVAALDTGMSQIEVSRAFGVSVATIQRYLRQRRLALRQADLFVLRHLAEPAIWDRADTTYSAPALGSATKSRK